MNPDFLIPNFKPSPDTEYRAYPDFLKNKGYNYLHSLVLSKGKRWDELVEFSKTPEFKIQAKETTDSGDTALILAVMNSNSEIADSSEEIVKLLIPVSDCNHQCDCGYNALMCVASLFKYTTLNTIKMLIPHTDCNLMRVEDEEHTAATIVLQEIYSYKSSSPVCDLYQKEISFLVDVILLLIPHCNDEVKQTLLNTAISHANEWYWAVNSDYRAPYRIIIKNLISMGVKPNTLNVFNYSVERAYDNNKFLIDIQTEAIQEFIQRLSERELFKRYNEKGVVSQDEESVVMSYL
jgi:hypothetical protein